MKIHRSILQTFLVFVVAASAGLVLLSRRDQTVTVAFDYDFRLNPACSPKFTKNCVKRFNVYDISSGGRTKLFSIPVPGGAAGSVKGITGTSPPVPLAAGKHTLAVTAESAEGTESDSSACATTVQVKRWLAFLHNFERHVKALLLGAVGSRKGPNRIARELCSKII